MQLLRFWGHSTAAVRNCYFSLEWFIAEAVLFMRTCYTLMNKITKKFSRSDIVGAVVPFK